MNHWIRVAPVVLAAVVALAVAAVSQKLAEPLEAFEPLIGTSWIGRFTSLPAPPCDHRIEWKAVLDGQVVRWTKRVEAVDFSMESYFYWDAELRAVAFTQLTSNGVHGKGVVEYEGGLITLVGVAMQTWGLVEFRQSFGVGGGRDARRPLLQPLRSRLVSGTRDRVSDRSGRNVAEPCTAVALVRRMDVRSRSNGDRIERAQRSSPCRRDTCTPT